MENCLTLKDLAEINRRPLAQLAQIGDELDPAKLESGSAFRDDVLRLEDRLKQFYQLGVLAAKRAKSPGEAAQIWGAVSEFADETLAVLNRLRINYPACGASELYDLALEYKSAAMRRAQLNQDAALCQTLPEPAGLS